MKHTIILNATLNFFHAVKKYVIKRNEELGFKFVSLDSVVSDKFNYSVGNSKLGQKKVLNYGLSIQHTCAGDAPCKQKGKCYGTGGCFQFGSNLQRVAENTAFVLVNRKHIENIVAVFQAMINENPKIKYFRHFEIGDIPYIEYINAMVQIAVENPDVTFWCYTKKYALVNAWIDQNGLDAMPSNLTIIFSHWRNDDGSYYPMDNRYDFPTSEYIPLGQEHLTETVTHVCPCSDPNVLSNCVNCDKPCFELKHGESMALLEHSTVRTRERDRRVKAAHKALKKSA